MITNLKGLFNLIKQLVFVDQPSFWIGYLKY